MILILLFVVITYNTLRFNSKQTTQLGERINFEVDTSAVNHLAAAIRFRTISYDIDDSTKYKQESLSAFDSLQTFLRITYPLTFKTLSTKVISNHSLLLHWKGTSSDKKPVILYAHTDVVPANSEGDSSLWKKEPFSGEIDKDFIYGRGAIDDKGCVIGIMVSVEKLIAENFVPSRDIYIAFGHDEEIGGKNGAKMIAAELEKSGVKAEFLLDEGGLVAIDMVPFVKPPVALVFTSEKGYLTLELTVKSNGGHSGFPPADPPIEILSKAIQKIHDYPFERRMTESVSNFMDYVGPEMKMPFKALFGNRWIFNSIIFGEYEKIPSANAMIRTTSVATVINGGSKENVVPSLVTAKINFRLLPGDSSAAVIQKVRDLIADEGVVVTVFGKFEEASEISSTDAEGFKLLSNVIGKTFPDAIVAPSLLIAQTDSRHFNKVTENIYRFNPVRMNDEILDTFHGKDERIGILDFMESIAFYKLLLKSL